MEGILITAGNKSLGRKSVVEFGWLVGLPDRVRTENFLHTKYVPDSGKEKASKQADQTGQANQASTQTQTSDGGNLGQNLFYRPASSGNYALVLNLEPARIGFNDISQQYAITLEDHARRFNTLLESVLYTLVQPRGAMRNTQNPHIVDCQGVVTWSTRAVPAPTISPIKDKYETEVEGIVEAMNGLYEGTTTVNLRRFSNLGELGEVIGELRKQLPYRIVLPATSA
jgi:CRISPR-associated protein Cst2